MSNFSAITRHPITHKYARAEYIDDYFGPHVYGVKFEGDEKVWPVDYIDSAQLKTFWVDDVIKAWAYVNGFSANHESLLTFLNQIDKEYKARWTRDPIGGEGAVEWFTEHLL